MENFIVSARKYRPQKFEDVVGQQHVTRTLQNAIHNNHLAQALLFTGPRGVGKTTCARILAREVNGGQAGDDNDFSFNIFELDAASNNSVENIRSLTDQVRFAPQAGEFKVYIIDEVHMLSQAAFNAFLKTLEEPPSHAIFILATTEKHKIIPTILSRCQIYDFKRISVPEIARHLESVARQEKIETEPEALHIIAQKADGALRDALSIFDRIVSFSGQKVTYQDVIENLRILDYDYYFKATDLILSGDGPALLQLFDDILDQGFDGHLFSNGLAAHFRDLLVCKDERSLQLLEVGENNRERYRQQAMRVEAGFLLEALRKTAEVDNRYRSSNHPRLLVELCLLELAAIHNPEGASEKKKSPQPQTTPETRPVKSPDGPDVKANLKTQTGPDTQAPAGQDTEVKAETPAPEATAPQPEPDKKSTPEPAPPPRETATSPRPRKRRGLSITESLQGEKQGEKKTSEQEEDPEAIKPGMPRDNFNQNRLDEVWQNCLEHLDQNGPKTAFASLRDKKLILKPDFQVVLTLENEIQRDFFDEVKSQVLGQLRQGLNNYHVLVKLEISPETHITEPYSAQEKFAYMLQKNEHLLTLKKKLNLDLE